MTRLLRDEHLIRRIERIVRDLAGRLPPPRDEALMTAAEAGYALLTGRTVRGGLSTHVEPAINLVAFRRAQAALDNGDVELALERADSLVRAHPDSMRVLRLRREIVARQGSLTEAARTLHRMHLLDDRPERHHVERMVLGRIVETSPGWLPRIPGPPRPVRSRDDSVVLHVLKESLPYLTNGFTMRSRYNLLAQRDAGLAPAVVTAPSEAEPTNCAYFAMTPDG